MFADLRNAITLPETWIYPAWLLFKMRYRKTLVGRLWVIAGPALFVFVLGELFKNVTAHSSHLFVPHLAVGLVLWNYVSNVANSGPRMYIGNRAMLMHGPINHMMLVLRVLSSAVVILLYQMSFVVLVLIVYGVTPTAQLLLLLPALLLLFAHSIWVLVVLGLIGARYRDVAEIVEMVMRIAFLATPIIWMPHTDEMRAQVIGFYLALNPFYHVVEPVRGALLGTPIPLISWVISSVIACFGLGLASFLYGRFRHMAVVWSA